jgi:hypothetical protein
MVKLAGETGRDTTKVLDELMAVLEEGAASGGAWNYLIGCSQKD